jgi:hypothetical protein
VPVVYNLKPESPDTKVKENPSVKYCTIAGDWKPSKGNCDLSLFSSMQLGGYNILPKPNDGIVSLSSVESLDYSNSLWNNKSHHTNLLSEYKYTLAKEILQGKK